MQDQTERLESFQDGSDRNLQLTRMDLPTLHRYFEVAEELYAAGHCLHAFVTLHALIAAPTIIPPYYRREEILCRVRAAEMLLYNSLQLPRRKQSAGRGNAAPSVTMAQLDLVYSVLSPMMSSRGYLEGVVVSPLLWCSGKRDSAAVTARERKESSEVERAKAEEEEEDGDGRIVPVALVVKAYTLSAIVHCRRMRHTQAVKCVEAAEQWCNTAFHTLLAGLATSLTDDTVAEVQNREEKRCCDAFLSVEFCRVYYSQLVSTTTSVATVNCTPSTAVLHATRAHAMERLLYHAKDYARYATSSGLEQRPLDMGIGRKCSSLCFSSPTNSFSIRAAARVLAQYYCATLILDQQVIEAERHMQRCEVIFGASPELQCMMQLLAVGLRGPLGWDRLRRVKRQRSESVSAECQATMDERGVPLNGKLRWLSDGLLAALKCYLAMHAAAMGTTATEAALPLTSGQTNSPVEVYAENDINRLSKNNQVRSLFGRTLRCIDEQLTLLTTETVHCHELHNTLKSLLCSSPSADIRFLVMLKCATLVTMSTYALSQLWLVEGVRHLHQLRRYMEVFHKHTTSLRAHYHLIVSQLTSMLSLRHLSCEGHASKGTETGEHKRLSEKDDEERTAGFDVGLPYAHVIAAEAAALNTAAVCLCSPSTLLLVLLAKGAAISHAARVGSALHLNDDGVTITSLTVHQRHRCATALMHVLEALKTSFEAASATEDESGEYGGERGLRQRRSAWTPSNHVFLLFLRGVAAMTAEKDELTATCMFKDALQHVRRYVGLTSGVAAELFYLLAMAYNESERAELHSCETPTSVSETFDESFFAVANETNCNAQRNFSLAWQVALHARRLTLLHCVLALQESDSKESYRHIVGEWNTEVHRVCSLMRRELMEVVAL
ncbi:hypothetical protein TraAM80_02312 [Trypanosoma rangeli]|uniref:Uncharacterized protein n=1 Tax=Trypanosoma rangeli TaxID=5698 RepID=A0A3R7NXB6_TRYRA|nr:uncharacterized protein TraAM80_02312 [Trypanosoma rangeli]RNF09168.1 hypothetical protein TraAM80_02312 [Trypanosoma rangeli]|eukprot:RNF09168.1 hypothetical protein TraAM80_02312 [Trypanosoma rangeli]